MRNLRSILLISLFVVSFSSCYESAKIKVENKIDQVKILDVHFGELYMAYQLLPGEVSSEIEITDREEKLPLVGKVTFVMSANNQSIYLETDEEFVLDSNDDLTIILDDDTPVSNPNE